jgi:hypothetical protein
MRTKVCTRCEKRKSIERFHRRANRPGGRMYHCKDCHRKLVTNWRGKNPENVKRTYQKWYKSAKGAFWELSYRLKKYYKITVEEYKSLLRKQRNRCAICRIKLSTPHVDHDHKTKKVRELLCRHCNHLLGNAKENINTLLRAINYLKKHRRKNGRR